MVQAGPIQVSARPAGDSLATRVPPAPMAARMVPLRCREPIRILVRGPVTGSAYQFSPQQDAQMVDTRDADLLLRTGRFRRI